MTWRWREADESVLRRLAARTSGGWTGFDPGDVPDSIWILHAIYERADGKVLESGDWVTAPADMQRLWWRGYAQRYNVPMEQVRLQYLLPGSFELEDYIDFPRDGVLDVESWTALAEHLVAVSPQGDRTACGAYFTTLLNVGKVFTGALGDSLDLYDDDGGAGPQNLWDLDETWIVYTDYDSWATRVSGPAELIARLIADERLETDPLPDVPKRA